ncbi:MAG: GNAT family N-acetyltransferase [Tepidisphaeraceae bacterium]
MSGLSNLLARRNDGSRGLIVRPVMRSEIDWALHLILAGTTGTSTESAVEDFRQLATLKNIDLTGIMVVAEPTRNTVVWAAIPMTGAGRQSLIMVPPRLRPGMSATHVAELLAALCVELAGPDKAAGVAMAQVLVEPNSKAVLRAVQDAGFDPIADLHYLAREVTSPIPGRIVSDEFRLWRYDRAMHYRFARAIERTYVDTMDCPKLTARRPIKDVIAGHKASGEFDPELWHLVSDVDNHDLGVLLLNRLHRQHGYELVYIGLVPEARGKGLGDMLIRVAMNHLAREGGGQIVTAVDASNAPARKLYSKHGFGFMYARTALCKDLETGQPFIDRPQLPTGPSLVLTRQNDNRELEKKGLDPYGLPPPEP